MIEEAEIVLHEADEPDVFGDLFDAPTSRKLLEPFIYHLSRYFIEVSWSNAALGNRGSTSTKQSTAGTFVPLFCLLHPHIDSYSQAS